MEEFKLNMTIDEQHCPHSRKERVMSDGKIKRYKEICATCGKYFRWVPNREALELGLKPDESWDIIKYD